jgi:hypothetical protein
MHCLCNLVLILIKEKNWGHTLLELRVDMRGKVKAPTKFRLPSKKRCSKVLITKERRDLYSLFWENYERMDIRGLE